MNKDVRETFHTPEYEEYYASLDERTKAKYDYVESIIKTQSCFGGLTFAMKHFIFAVAAFLICQFSYLLVRNPYRAEKLKPLWYLDRLHVPDLCNPCCAAGSDERSEAAAPVHDLQHDRLSGRHGRHAGSGPHCGEQRNGW